MIETPTAPVTTCAAKGACADPGITFRLDSPGDDHVSPGTFSPEWQGLAAAHEGLMYPDVAAEDMPRLLPEGLVYVATPFTKRVTAVDGGVDQSAVARCRAECENACAALLRREITGISPILVGLGVCASDPARDLLDDAFWVRAYAPLLKACVAIVAPDLPGRGESNGVLHEVRHMLGLGRPVLMLRGAL